MGVEQDQNVEKVVIIGSGPAGWTAAIYAARANLEPLMFVGRGSGKDIMPGGQLMLTTDVENFPGFPEGIMGPDMMQTFAKQALRFGTRVVTDKGIQSGGDLNQDAPLYGSFQNVRNLDTTQHPFVIEGDNNVTIKAHSVIVATGAKANWLGLDNEERLASSGGGVSACAVCDGALPMFRDQPLGVVGGGDTAVEEASYLTKFASKVYLIHRRDELRASKIMAERAIKNPKIEILWNKVVVDVLGEDKVTGVQLKDTVTDEVSEMQMKGLFIAIGHTPITQFLNGQIETDEEGYIVLKDHPRTTTNVEGVFAAGDVSDKVYRQAVTAAGMGCKAALDAEHYLANIGVV